MSKKNVTTIKGEILPISKTKKFPNGYYKIGEINVENSGDCYKINDKFYRFETGQIIFNNSKKEYQLINNDVILGLIENNNLGYFNRNEPNKIPIILENGTKSFAINESILIKNLNYREQISTGDYVHISRLTAKNFNKKTLPSNEYKTSLPYDSNINCFTMSPLIQNLSFGLEFETTAGFVPERITKKLGLIPLRDGSITGLEYVTIPFSGAKGIQTIVDISKELEKRTTFDNSCALHLHIGNIPRTPEFILAFLKVTSFLQNDIFSLFPLYKKYNMGIKNKNYSKPYNLFDIFSKLDPVINGSNINKNFDVFFSFLTSYKTKFSDYSNNLNNVETHPLDPSTHQKWNIKTRYYFHNFIPLIFGNKQTIEFRIHTPTFDYNKIIMFLLLNSILINFTIKHTKEILEKPNFLKNVVDSISGKENNLLNIIYYIKSQNLNNYSYIFDSLLNYISFRKSQIETLLRSGDIMCDEKHIKYLNKIDFDTNRNIVDKIEKEDDKKLIDDKIIKEVPMYKHDTTSHYYSDFSDYITFGDSTSSNLIKSYSKKQLKENNLKI